MPLNNLKNDALYHALLEFEKTEKTPKKPEMQLECMKNLFFDSKSFKWSLKSCSRFIQESNIHPEIFISFFQLVVDNCFLNNQKGKASALSFLERLKKSNSFKRINSHKKRIPLKEGVLNDREKKLEFFRAIKELNEEYLNISSSEMINFIDRNFNTGFTESTLRRYYFDNL